MILLFMLCVSLSGGGENCDYSWEVIDNYMIWDYLIKLYGVHPDSKGFTILSEKLVYVKSTLYTAKTLSHEARHVLCHIEYPLDKNCHIWVDANYRVLYEPVQYEPPQPPRISDKLKDAMFGTLR